MSLKAPIQNPAQNRDDSSPEPPASESKFGSIMWAILVVAALAEISYGMVNFSATPVYIKALGLDPSFIGIASMSYLLCEAMLKAPFGVLGDRVGRKRLLVIAPIISIFTSLATIFVHHPIGLICLRAVDGMALAALWPSAFGIISDYSKPGERAKAMSLFNISYMAGIAGAPALGGAVDDIATHFFHLEGIHKNHPSFYACAAFFAITAIVAALVLPSGKPPTHEIAQTEATEELAAEGGFNLVEFRKMLATMPGVLWLAFTIFMGVGLIMAYAKPFLTEHFHISASEYGMLILVPAIIVGALSFPLGTLGDKIGKVRAIRIGLGLAALGFWCALIFPVKLLLLVFGVVMGIGYVIAYPSVFAYVSENCDPNQKGAAIGAVGTAQGLGAIIGATASSILIKHSAFNLLGFFPVPAGGLIFLGCGIMIVLSFLIAVFALKPHASPLPCD